MEQLLIIEDDLALAGALTRSFERRGYAVRHLARYEDLAETLEGTQPTWTPTRAIVDLKLAGSPGHSGLDCVRDLHRHDAGMRVVVLTGFASINTAVEAIKLGACHYLPKPANSDDIERAFNMGEGGDDLTKVARLRPEVVRGDVKGSLSSGQDPGHAASALSASRAAF
ncbi:response regulator [Pseudogemmobacter bohemicus]|uniref:response regulator n=1 Tax=Pseudogemmobacter bohemicus TaxID=2250708 RepID=UPI000DD2F9AB|nr:response regulator [Pseudogemmobacter bohemicus]